MSPLSPTSVPVRPARQRLLLLPWMVLVLALGLGSRSPTVATHVPRFLTTYAGDTLWASLLYLCLLFAWPRLPVRRAAAWTLGLSVLVELSQLIHTPWLDALRANRFVALVLGRGFVASDLVCYAVGVALAAGTDAWSATWSRASNQPAVRP